MKCQNCGATHGCGCQARTANDGTQCCSKCVQTYNMNHPGKGSAVIGQPSPNNHQGTAPIIHSVTYNRNL